MTLVYDICVIGAGMMGSGAARHIAQLRPDLHVLLIGPEEAATVSDPLYINA